MGHSLIDNALKVCGSRYKLAATLGVDQGNLSKIYSGKAPMPPALAARIADVAGLDPKDAAAVAIIEAERDPEAREALKKVFFRTGVVGMLAFSMLGAWPGSAQSMETALQTGNGKPTSCVDYVNSARRLKIRMRKRLKLYLRNLRRRDSPARERGFDPSPLHMPRQSLRLPGLMALWHVLRGRGL